MGRSKPFGIDHLLSSSSTREKKKKRGRKTGKALETRRREEKVTPGRTDPTIEVIPSRESTCVRKFETKERKKEEERLTRRIRT